MARGGARNRSGPPPDPRSGRSERRGIRLTALPSEPFEGDVPEFGLPGATERELELWSEAWTWPQAWAWSQPSERWRLRPLRMWVRLSVAGEATDVNAAMLSQIHRFADQSALTQAGLREAGWAIASDELSAKAAEHDEAKKPRARRLRAVSGDAQ